MTGQVYISGPITGLPYEVAYSRFDAAETMIGTILPDARIVNPMKLKCEGSDWKDFMKNDIAHLMDCDTVFMLEGWRKSRGARIEHFIASECEKAIIELKVR